MVPIFKRGNHSILSNYRPVYLLSAISKVCKRVVSSKLYPQRAPVLNHQQSGFWRGDGTSQQLLRLVQLWSEALDESKYIGVVFFDLLKGFDSVWHRVF